LPDGSLDFLSRGWLEYGGLTLTDLKDWRWTAAIHPEDVEVFADKWRGALASGEPFEAESRVRRADGEYRWFLQRNVPLRDETGEIVKWYGTGIDIEERKTAEDKIGAQETELRQIVELALSTSVYLGLVEAHSTPITLRSSISVSPSTNGETSLE
jgi:PAS domain S-box-containing protein